MRTKTFTVLFTVIGAALCLIHYLFHQFDSIYMIFYSLSVPMWFASMFTSVYNVSVGKLLVIYALTVASWAVIGYVIDRFAYSRRRSW